MQNSHTAGDSSPATRRRDLCHALLPLAIPFPRRPEQKTNQCLPGRSWFVSAFRPRRSVDEDMQRGFGEPLSSVASSSSAWWRISLLMEGVQSSRKFNECMQFGWWQLAVEYRNKENGWPTSFTRVPFKADDDRRRLDRLVTKPVTKRIHSPPVKNSAVRNSLPSTSFPGTLRRSVPGLSEGAFLNFRKPESWAGFPVKCISKQRKKSPDSELITRADKYLFTQGKACIDEAVNGMVLNPPQISRAPGSSNSIYELESTIRASRNQLQLSGRGMKILGGDIIISSMHFCLSHRSGLRRNGVCMNVNFIADLCFL
nr:hypothetical protein Iba_chr05dCG1830 [Ipomoea batatas]